MTHEQSQQTLSAAQELCQKLLLHIDDTAKIDSFHYSFAAGIIQRIIEGKQTSGSEALGKTIADLLEKHNDGMELLGHAHKPAQGGSDMDVFKEALEFGLFDNNFSFAPEKMADKIAARRVGGGGITTSV